MKKQKPPVVQEAVDERFTEFLARIKRLDIAVCTYLPQTRDRRKPESEKTGHFIFEEWTIGGQTGGSCWDTGDSDPHYPVDGEREPEFVDFDRILEELVPEISFLKYKRLSQELEWDQIIIDPGCPGCGQPWIYFQDVAPTPNSKAIDA